MIGPFEDEYRFLSNFAISPIVVDGKEYQTVEHAYQAAKTLDENEREMVRLALTPGKAKRLGQKVTLREDWDDVKVAIMAKLLELKFQDRELREKLLATGDEELIELNWWHDTFWGVCTGGSKCSCVHNGESMLGKLLMGFRAKIRNEIHA